MNAILETLIHAGLLSAMVVLSGLITVIGIFVIDRLFKKGCIWGALLLLAVDVFLLMVDYTLFVYGLKLF